MPQIWIALGAVICAVSVMAGAFGAHGLKARLPADDLARWETAARYFMYTGFGVVLIGLTALVQAHHGDPRRAFDLAAAFLLGGGMVFSGTVAAIALGAPRWLGAITPLGGLFMILGFLVFGAFAWRIAT